jgi:hypothetical protein
MPFMSDLAEVTRQHVQLAVREGTDATLVGRLVAGCGYAADVAGEPALSGEPDRPGAGAATCR